MDIQPPPEGKPVNRWRTTKKAGKAGLGAASTGITVAQYATGVSTIAILTAGAAASATGIGLVVTGAALTVTTSTLSAVSAGKSWKHRNNLQAIYDRRNAYACGPIDPKGPRMDHHEHQTIADNVLPYTIGQKDAKFKRKVVGAVPGVGLLETARAIGKKAYKAAKGTLGVQRKRAATWLARHLITHNCGLAQSIVAELYSFEEMLWIKDQEMDQVVKLLEDKLAST
jgi:hypothetical protein